MPRVLGILVLCFVHLLAAGGTAHADGAPGTGQRTEACSCPDPFAPDTPVGVVWQGPAPAPDLPTLARLLAPALWFSSDEPLLVGRSEPIPQPHPCDSPAERAVVYYQATQIVLRGQERVDGSGETDERFFEKVDHFILKYFFYYDEDRGLRPHPHDLEALTMLVYLEQLDAGCLRVRLRRVEALAHGVHWYSNILNIERDTVFPLMVLVEEGKHAPVPDRNADGVYTPGYDVNARVNDAWGLRDVLGSSVLLGSGYTASMSKPRDDAFRLLPPEDAPVCAGHRRARNDASASLGRYELRPATHVATCHPDGPQPERLLRMMRTQRFGREWPADQFDSELARRLSDPEATFRWLSGVNARYESARVHAVLQGPGYDMREFWVVPRVQVSRGGWALEALVTPSASRWVDWYVAAGYEHGLARLAPDEDDVRQALNGFGGELGLKFRVRAPGRARWALLGYRFGGVRVGVRSSGFTRIREPRLIVEVGPGAF
jgi:hypothetical protein